MKTESETCFEEFCRRNGVPLLGVPVSKTKTPDYWLTVAGQRIVIEVKEIQPTAEEQEADRLATLRGWGEAVKITPGKRVRKKIEDCAAQIRSRTMGVLHGVLVLWEGGLCAGRHSGPYHVRVAMAGFEQVLLDVPPVGSGRSPSFAGMKHGPSRKMTETANTSISAVAVLCRPQDDDKLLLQLYHNRYAAIPLDPTLLTCPEVRQYELRDSPNGTTEWQPV